MTYAAVAATVRSIGQALLDRGLGPERPVLILAENSIDHALMALGAMQVGVPVAPVSTAYSRRSQDFAKLRAVRDQVRPGLVFVDDGAAHAASLDAIGLDGAELVVAGTPHPRLGGTAFSTLVATQPTPRVDAAFAAVRPKIEEALALEARIRALELSQGLAQLDFVGDRIDHEQEIALVDDVAVLEVNFRQRAADLSAQLDVLHRR